MRASVAFLAGALALTAAAAPAAPRLSPDAELAKAIEGRVAGEPVDCINLTRVRSSRVIEGTAIVYDAGSTIYVNRPRSGAEDLDRWDSQVVKPFGTQLCSVDVVRMYDLQSRMQTGLVFLGEFVPYRKVSARR